MKIHHCSLPIRFTLTFWTFWFPLHLLPLCWLNRIAYTSQLKKFWPGCMPFLAQDASTLFSIWQILTHFLRHQFSYLVMFNWPYGLQHTRLPGPSPTPGACSNSCPSSQWCHPTNSTSVVPSPPPSVFPSIRVFSSESVLRIRWPNYWSFSFSISLSNEYSELISFRMHRFDLLAVHAGS